jgi:hypothetical protein
MKIITITDTRAVRVGEIAAIPQQVEIVEYALNAYGYLMNCQPPGEYKLSDFADVIARSYDTQSNSRNRAVVETLRVVQEQTERVFATVH